jgi:hypothetical protein
VNSAKKGMLVYKMAYPELNKFSTETWEQWLFRTDGRLFWGTFSKDSKELESLYIMLCGLDQGHKHPLLEMLLISMIEQRIYLDELLAEAPTIDKTQKPDLFDNFYFKVLQAQEKYEKTGDRSDLERLYPGQEEELYTIQHTKSGKNYVWKVKITEEEKKFREMLNKPLTKKQKDFFFKLNLRLSNDITTQQVEELEKLRQEEWLRDFIKLPTITFESTRTKKFYSI